MGVLVVSPAHAKVSSLRGGLPWTSGSRSKQPFNNGEKRIHQLEGISRPYRVTCLEGFGLRLEDGKRATEQIQRAILCDQVEEITRECRACPTCSRVRAIHDYRTRVFDTLFGGLQSKPRAQIMLFLRCQGSGRPQRASFSAGFFRTRPGHPRAAADPCRAWVSAFLSGSRTTDEELSPLPPAPSYHFMRPVASDYRVAGAQPHDFKRSR